MISSDLSSDLSGFVSTIFFSDEDNSYKYAKQMLPVSDLNSSLAEKDLKEMEDPSLPALLVNGTKDFVRTGREYLKYVRREAEALQIQTAPSVKHVILTKTGAYIPYDLKADPSDSFEDERLEHSARNQKKTPEFCSTVPPVNTDALDLRAFLGARERVHDWQAFEHRFFSLREQLARRRASYLVDSAVSPVQAKAARNACLEAIGLGRPPRLLDVVPLAEGDLLDLIDCQAAAVAAQGGGGACQARLHAQWMFALLVATPAALIDPACVASIDAACASVRARLLASGGAPRFVAAAGCVSALDVLAAAARALRPGHRRGPRRRQRGRAAEPGAARLQGGRWGEGLSGLRAAVTAGGRAVWIEGESTALSDAGVEEGRWYAGVKVLHLASKDAFVGVCVTGPPGPPPDLDRYLPEIGYGLRGGVDKGRRKSLPQYAAAGGRAVADTGAFVRNFRAGQLLGLIIDADLRQARRPPVSRHAPPASGVAQCGGE
jgi:hypothetical protein